jgi:hypothetical protein
MDLSKSHKKPLRYIIYLNGFLCYNILIEYLFGNFKIFLQNGAIKHK